MSILSIDSDSLTHSSDDERVANPRDTGTVQNHLNNMEEDTAKPLLRDGHSPSEMIEMEDVGGDADGTLEKDKSESKVNPEDVRKLRKIALGGNVAGVKILINTYEGDAKALVNGCDEDGWTLLHSVVRGGTLPVIQALIDAGAEINKTDIDGASPLHSATGYSLNDSQGIVQFLVTKGGDLGVQDTYGDTPLHDAVRSKQQTVTNFILEHPICNVKYLELKNKHGETALHMAARYNVSVQLMVDKGAGLLNQDNQGWTPLHHACVTFQDEACQILLETGRQQMKLQDMLQAKNNKGDTPLHIAAKAGAETITQQCFIHGADILAVNNEQKNPLHLAAENKKSQGFMSLFKPELWLDGDNRIPLMMEKRLTMEAYLDRVKNLVGQAIVERDIHNNNCLNIAIQNDNEEVAMAIVKSRHCRSALMNPICHSPPNTPMRGLIRNMPDVAEEAMTQCLNPIDDSIPDHLDRREFVPSYNVIDDSWSISRKNIVYGPDESGRPSKPEWTDENYDDKGYLLPEQEPYSRNSTTLRKNHPLILMCDHNEELLTHKLVRQLIFHKWDSLGRYVYYTTLFIYLVFLFFFTGFTLTSKAPFQSGINRSAGNFTLDNSDVLKVVFIDVGRWIVVVLLSLYVLRELMEMYSWKASYFTHTENLIEWLLFLTATLFIIDFDSTGNRTDWQWQVGAVAIFLAWINLILFIRKLPLLGIYIVMVAHILKTFLIFSPVFVLFVAAFALSFTVLFKNQYEFNSVGHSVIKTFVMMIGELDFGDIFFGTEENPEAYSHAVFYSVTSYAIFVLFLVIMTIIIMNLLVGLAVDDIQGVQEYSEIRRLAMQVELVIDLEFLVPHNLYKRFIRHVPIGGVTCPKIAMLYNPVVRKIDKILNPKRPKDPVLKAVEEQAELLYEQGKLIREQGKMIQQLQGQQERMMKYVNRQMHKLLRYQESQRDKAQ